MFVRSMSLAVLAAALMSPAAAQSWIASPEIIREGGGGASISGVVFHDENGNGRQDRGERGVRGVLVSNGETWTRTDRRGEYEIAVRADMDLTIVQPSGWRVPTDDRLAPQFFYVHKPGGTGYEMRYGGLPDTGPAPAAVNFPLRRLSRNDAFTCAVIGDSQTYANREIGWFRDSVVTDLAAMGLGAEDCVLYVGDVMGDDLDLLDRLLEVGAAAGAPQWLVHGNHDFDFDARSDAESADSWRRLYGPTYYAFEQGDVLFVVLDNVVYPCGEEDMTRPGHEFCADSTTYNGRITETQLAWLEALLNETPDDRLIVLAHHIPFVSFVDAGSSKHQTDDLDRIHALLEGRRALSLSGHTHTIENHSPGQSFTGWAENTGAGPLPFRHIIAGAASGSWYQGDFNVDGTPMSLQRMGAPSGVLMLDFDGADYVERYVGARIDPGRVKWTGVSTADFRTWFDALNAWRLEDAETRDPVPPVNLNDLPDPGIVTPADLAAGVFLTANVWAGSAETIVTAQLPDGRTLTMERTQTGDGEAPKIGADWADPVAAERQLMVGRHALQSRSGDERAQGFELWQGRSIGPGPAQPQRAIADRNMHLWRAALPADLPFGAHRITVTSTDRHARASTDVVILEVRESRPPQNFRSELWGD